MLFQNQETNIQLEIAGYEFPPDGGAPGSDDRNWLVMRCAWTDEEGVLRKDSNSCLLTYELRELAARRDVTVLLAHMERYLPYVEEEDWRRIAHSGVLLQSNADFFCGFSTRRKALRLLREGWIQVLGTDCHNMTSRAPRMDEAVRRIARALGEDAVQRLEMQAAALLPAREADP